jgi:hypothetical protein
MGANVDLAQSPRVQGFNGCEMATVLPEEFNQPKLRKHTDYGGGVLLDNDDPVDSTSKYLDGAGQGRSLWKKYERVLGPKVLEV